MSLLAGRGQCLASTLYFNSLNFLAFLVSVSVSLDFFAIVHFFATFSDIISSYKNNIIAKKVIAFLNLSHLLV